MARYNYFDRYAFPEYTTVHARRLRADRHRTVLEQQGRTLAPIVVDGRKIASTFWGRAWCANLERYSDFANRLPRGRSYVRNGLVVDLEIGAGQVLAIVSGSELYDVRIAVAPVAGKQWKAICSDCAGAIDTVVELLQGQLSDAVMSRLCEPKTGLFPTPGQLTFQCSCPDSARMCKHVAAVLYGIGARLDREPALLFTLRHVDERALVAGASARLSQAGAPRASARVLVHDDLAGMFGIDMADEGQARAKRAVAADPPAKRKTTVKRKRARQGKATSKGRVAATALRKAIARRKP